MTSPTRYDLSTSSCNPAEGEECGAEMIVHPGGDYVEYTEHESIVSDLQSTIDDLREQISRAVNALT